MSLWKIAWRSIQQRGLASLLTTFSMALGVTLVIAVLSIHGIIAQSFENNASLGYNMIVGAKGGKLQLTLNTVYYLSTPVENIDYAYFLEFLPSEERDAAFRHSLQSDAHDALWQTLNLQSLAAGPHAPAAATLAGIMADRSAEQVAARHEDLSGLVPRSVVPMQRGRETRFGALTQFAIPLCLGDYYGNFRVVGTTPDLVDKLRIGAAADRPLEFAAGRNFQTYSEEHGYYEAIVGSRVASQMNVQVGTQFAATHGDPDSGGHAHDELFTIVGILKPTGTPHDRAVYVNMEGFYLMEDHAKPVEEEGMLGSQAASPLAALGGTLAGDAAAGDGEETESPGASTAGDAADDSADNSPGTKARPDPLPVEQREVTAILLRTSPLVALGMPNMINEGREAQCVMPIRQIAGLFELIVKPIQWTLLALTAMICVVSGIGILVSIYNSMSERRHEIAVMRALGAGRGTVMTVILLESIMLSVGGGALGWVLGHSINAAASPAIEAQTGVRIHFWDLAPGPNLLDLLDIETEEEATRAWFNISNELLVIPALVLLAVIVGFLPAVAAYHTDVAKSLGA